jgi:predicted ferric reductase
LNRTRMVLLSYRIPGTDWTSGNALFSFFYIAANVVCLLAGLAGGYDYARGSGSLAAANTMMAIIPATRNSVLTWFLGLPFDHVVIYHRFIGRVAIACGLLHTLLYLDHFKSEPTSWIVVTGAISMSCGLIIFLTSLNWCRRHQFNIFFWLHYSFLGYLVLGLLHSVDARPFIIVGIGCYAFDRLLRAVWMRWPISAQLFVNRGDDIAHIRFKKNALTNALGMHKVGQYYFVNFPGLSLLEWHPFSVSSGPREDSVELHIRALGDHTSEIVKLATERSSASEPTTTWIRTDGPYGCLDVATRRFPVLILVGGGIGVTPVIGMLKDIYNVGDLSSKQQQRRVLHSNKVVHCVWVVPHARDFLCFADTLYACVKQSQLNCFPALKLEVYITRASDDDPLLAKHATLLRRGRPDFTTMFTEISREHQKSAAFVFSCGPSAIINQLWDLSVKRSKSGSLVQFHHETFEF